MSKNNCENLIGGNDYVRQFAVYAGEFVAASYKERGGYRERKVPGVGTGCILAGKRRRNMKISKILTKLGLTFWAGIVLLLAVGAAPAQTDTVKKIRLKNPATVTGTIGGESHDGYVIRVRKNQTLKVRIDWKEKGDRTAQFVVSRSDNFFDGDVIRGISTYNEKNWRSRIRKTGDYYIYVTAHPVANYTLKVSVK
jgi:hypothetical protein